MTGWPPWRSRPERTRTSSSFAGAFMENGGGARALGMGGAVTAEALQLKLWQRAEQRQDVTAALEALERSMVATLRHCLGWDFGAGANELSTIVEGYRMREDGLVPLGSAP